MMADQIVEIQMAEIQIAGVHIAEIQMMIQIIEIAVTGKADEEKMIEMTAVTAILVGVGIGAIHRIALRGTLIGATIGTMTGTMIVVGIGITHLNFIVMKAIMMTETATAVNVIADNVFISPF